jgi:photosystem II stability/assembly factor-like uncharacterized protein
MIYRSTDNGADWVSVPFRHDVSALHVLALSSGDSPRYLLGAVPRGASESGLYISSDKGDSWKAVDEFLGKSIFAIAVSRKDQDVIAVGGENGVYLSSDAGSSWRRISPAANSELTLITSVAFDPNSSDVIYAGTAHLPWKTTDRGNTWRSIHTGMIDDSDVFSIETDHSRSGRIFASACSGIYASDNGGAQWRKLLGIPHTSRRTYTIRQDPFEPQVLFAGTSQGFWRSNDGGAVWRKLSDVTVKSIAFDAQRDQHLFVATHEGGVMVSNDHGDTLQPLDNGFAGRDLTALTVSLSGAVRGLFAASPYSADTVYRLSPEGSWSRVSTATISGMGHLLSVFPLDGETLMGYTETAAVRSKDAGRTWQAVSPPGVKRVLCMQVTSAEPGGVLLATDAGLFLTSDLGARWNLVWERGQSIDSLFAPREANAAIVAIAANSFGRSTDGGHTWQAIEPPAPAREIYDIAIGRQGVLLVATARGAFRSSNSGDSWTRISDGLNAGTIRAISFNSSFSAAVAIQHGVAYVSRDGGSTWKPLDSTGLEGANIRALVLPAWAPDKIYALTQFRGVLVSDLPDTPNGTRAPLTEPTSTGLHSSSRIE